MRYFLQASGIILLKAKRKTTPKAFEKGGQHYGDLQFSPLPLTSITNTNMISYFLRAAISIDVLRSTLL